MLKTKAIELLGGNITAAAHAIGISYEAVYKWPDTLTAKIADRVHAALGRKAGTKVSRSSGPKANTTQSGT